MRKWAKGLLATAAITLSLSFTSLADQWYQDMNGWWYGDEQGNASYIKEGWNWIDDDNDGTAECYYFKRNGRVASGAVIGAVDGCSINKDGAWVVDGVVQTKKVEKRNTNDSEAMKVYQAAQEKNADLDSIDAKASYDMTMKAEGESLRMGMDLDLKMRGVKTGNLEYLMAGTVDVDGSEYSTTAFYTGGYMYMEMLGIKMKTPMSLGEAVASARESLDTVNMDNAAYMSNLTMRTEGENTILSYTVDAAAFNEMMNNILSSDMMAEADSTGTRMEMTVYEASGEVTIDRNGYYAAEKMYMDMGMRLTDAESGETADAFCIMDVTVTINNPGQEASFTLPSTAGYVEAEDL